jgi:hypothetical protein
MHQVTKACFLFPEILLREYTYFNNPLNCEIIIHIFKSKYPNQQLKLELYYNFLSKFQFLGDFYFHLGLFKFKVSTKLVGEIKTQKIKKMEN